MYYSCIILSSKDLCKFTFSTCSLFWIRCHLKRVPSKDLKTFDYSFKCSFSFFFFFFYLFIKTICENIRTSYSKRAFRTMSPERFSFLFRVLFKVLLIKKNVQQSQKQNWLQRFKKYNKQQLYCGTVVLASYCYGGDTCKMGTSCKTLSSKKAAI